MYEIVSSFEYYLQWNNKPVNLFDKLCYTGLTAVLDAHMKELARKGIGINKHQVQIITEEDNNILWFTIPV